MDSREQRSFIRFLAGELKSHSRELAAYRAFAHLLKQAGVSGVDQLLETARHSPRLEAKLQENFAGLEALLPPPDPSHDEVEKEMLAKWRSESKWLN